MINLSTNENAIIFTFSNSKHYLTGSGTIEVPKSSLTLVTDDSDMATFRKSASNDIFVSAPYSEFGKTKAELIEWFEENGFSDGGSGGVTPEDVEDMIDEAIAPIETEIAGKQDAISVTAPILLNNNTISIRGNRVVSDIVSTHAAGGKTLLMSTINNVEQNISMAVGSINGERIAALHQDYVKDFQLATKQELEDDELVTAQAFTYLNNKIGDIETILQSI